MASRIERLLNLLNILIGAERPVTIERVREMVPGYPEDRDSFKRQFERDKVELRNMGLPLEARTIPGTYPPVTGYRIPRDEAFLRDPGLDPDELAALQLATSAIRLDGIEGSGGLWKLGAGPSPSGREGIADLPADDRLVQLFSAVADRRRARFTYSGVEREVDPWRLDCARGRWYVSGHDHTRRAARNFRIERIEGAVRLGDPGGFERPPGEVEGVRFEAWRFGPGEPEPALLLVDADHVGAAQQAAPSAEVVEERSDGSIVLQLAVSEVDAFRTLVLGFLEHAEVLDPTSLREHVVDWLTWIVQDAEASPV